MERLTEKVGDGVQLKKCGNSICMAICNSKKDCSVCPIDEAFRKLADYEIAEEQGLLVRLPCKVGNIVYDIFFGYPEAHMVKAISYGYFIGYVEPKIENEIIFYCENCTNTMRAIFPMRELGKTVFLTREEAEKKLEEMKK